MATIASATGTALQARSLSRYVILAKLRRRGVTLWDVAKAAGASTGYVSAVLGRQVRTQTPLVGRIWAEVERRIG